MRPSARLLAAIDILAALDETARPADRFLRDWFRVRRYAGSKDRAAVSERVFSVLRHRFSLAWRLGSDSPRALVIASLLAEGENPEYYFDGAPYSPSPLTDAERRAIASPPSNPPLSVQGEYPSFLEEELFRSFQINPVIPAKRCESIARAGTHQDAARLLEEMRALCERAPITLRANALKTTRDALLAALRAEGFVPEPTPYSPWGLRLPPGEGLAKLSATKFFADGAFEFQDESAQLAALLCDAKPGMRVLDFAAGAGGKTLALAAAMKNRGEIVAHDVSASRLAQLSPRAARSGATIIHIPPPERGRLGGGPFDLVLLDSPCSGTGTWRRQPELRARLTPARLAELTALQDELLAQAAPFVAPGSRLVYATCSLLMCENDDRIARFLAQNPDFSLLPAAGAWPKSLAAPPGLDAFFRASPRQTGTDGFFTAILQRAR